MTQVGRPTYRVGVTDAGHSPWMVFEYMPYGDLAEVLRSNSRQLWKTVPGLPPLTKVRLLSLEKYELHISYYLLMKVIQNSKVSA